MKGYLSSQLCNLYNEREAGNIIAELFRSYKNWNRADILLNANSRISESEMLQFHFAAKRLAQGEPLQYIVGHTWFRGLEIKVNPGVLIPRPETEELVQLVLNKNSFISPRVLDIGTGSGCIAISLKNEIPDAHVSAIDISENALLIAKQNAELNKAEINFIHQDILTADLGTHKYDVIVSNPPYIPLSEKGEMRKQVTEHEPDLALFVPDENALVFYNKIIALAKKYLSSDGKVFCEIHERMEGALKIEFEKNGVKSFDFLQDMQGKTRMFYFSL